MLRNHDVLMGVWEAGVVLFLDIGVVLLRPFPAPTKIAIQIMTFQTTINATT